MANIIQIFILLILREFFLLIPPEYLIVPGIIRAYDLGLLLCVLYILVAALINPAKFKFASNSLTFFVLAFCGIIIFSPLISKINYGQPYIVGFRAVRGSFFYLYFFVLVFGIDSASNLDRYIKFLKYFAFFLVIMVFSQSLLGVTLFHRASNDLSRLGMSRMINPGIDVIILAFFILFGNFIDSKKPNGIIDILLLCIFALQICLTLSRAVMFGCFLAALAIIVISKEYSKAIKLSFLGIMVISCFFFAQFTAGGKSGFELGIISDLYYLTFHEISNASGNVGARLTQAEKYLKMGFEHWFMGTGYISPIGVVAKKLNYPATRKDLGFIIMFSQYGLVSVIWLAGLTIAFFKKSFSILRNDTIHEYRGLVLGLTANFIYLLISFITLPNFIDPDRISVTAINLALLQVVYFNGNFSKQTSGKVFST